MSGFTGCNCPSCRGEGPPDEPEMPEPSDAFIAGWIADGANSKTIADNCSDDIEKAWVHYLKVQKEEE